MRVIGRERNNGLTVFARANIRGCDAFCRCVLGGFVCGVSVVMVRWDNLEGTMVWDP